MCGQGDQVRGDGGIRSIGLATRGMAGEKEGVTMVIAGFLSLVNGKHVLCSLKQGTWERNQAQKTSTLPREERKPDISPESRNPTLVRKMFYHVINTVDKNKITH